MHLGRFLLAAAMASSMSLLTGAIDRDAARDQRLLAAHNRERALVGAPALEWDERLAAGARDWALVLARSGEFEHAPTDTSNPDSPGENLWAGTPGAWSPEEMVGLWIAEKSDYSPGPIPAVSRNGDFADVGHYTQLIWAKTRKVGCALARGAREDVLVCRYSDAGNVMGERPI